MSDPTVERFRALVEQRFRFLEGHGFRRSPPDEPESPVGASVVYLGHHIGFRISYDVRDRQVDMRVVRVRDGRVMEVAEGGYSRDLLQLLVERGYRGGWGARGAAGGDPLEPMVDAWADLLRSHGDTLLADRPHTLE
jgi:hypothetical protein